MQQNVTFLTPPDDTNPPLDWASMVDDLDEPDDHFVLIVPIDEGVSLAARDAMKRELGEALPNHTILLVAKARGHIVEIQR